MDKAKADTNLQLLISENKFFSHEIITLQEESIVLKATRELLVKIHSSSFYSIISDEAIDFSETEQLSFTVRHCKDDYDAKEDFIGFFPCRGGVTSKALLKYVKDLLIRCNMNPQKMVGMSFEGASSMKNLAKLIKENVAQQALYVYCFAHANELVFKDATALSPMIAYAQDFCEDLYALVGVYPKRVLLFESKQ